MIEDDELIGRFKDGDLTAFDQLMTKYYKSIYYLALGRTNNHEDAEDIAQEAFSRVFKSLPKWKPKASFYTWLRTISINLCIDHHRAKIRRQTQSLEDTGGFAMNIPADPSRNPVTNTESSELMDIMLKAAEKLSPQQHRAFMLFHYGGLSLKEAAEVMGCAVGTIKAHLNRATAKMRDLLKDLANDWEIKKKDEEQKDKDNF